MAIQKRGASFSVGGRNCSCNGGADTFAEVDDVEAQLLKPGKSNGLNSIRRITPGTGQGLENIRKVFSTPSNAPDTLETGDVAPGETRRTGNSWIRIRGAFSLTFAYWRRVMTAAFDLIAEMKKTIAWLYGRPVTRAVSRAQAAVSLRAGGHGRLTRKDVVRCAAAMAQKRICAWRP